MHQTGADRRAVEKQCKGIRLVQTVDTCFPRTSTSPFSPPTRLSLSPPSSSSQSLFPLPLPRNPAFHTSVPHPSLASSISLYSTLLCAPAQAKSAMDEYAVSQLVNVVAQRYIKDPLLINDTKFDLRVYILVLSCDPLRVFFFRDGLVRCPRSAAGSTHRAPYRSQRVRLSTHRVITL